MTLRDQPKRNKYNAKKTVYNGRMYDSKREAAYAYELDVLKKAGEIVEIEHQPRFELIPKPNRVCYVADFRVTYKDGRQEIIDVKGKETTAFKIKKKLFHHVYPDLTLRIVK